jgi:hypothetical protein
MNNNPSINVKIDPNVLTEELDGEAVLLNLTNEHYFGLDDIGLRFWQLLEQHGNTADVIQQMKIEYDVAEEILHKDLGKLIVELENASLLTIVEASKASVDS